MTSTNEILFLLQVACIIMVCWGCQLLGRSALVSWLCLQGILANVLVLKLVRLFHLEVTVTDAFSIGSLYCVNILRARYGKSAAQEGVATAFLLSMSTALFLAVHNQFTAIQGGQITPLYDKLFEHIIPIMCISAIIFSAIQVLDYCVFGYLHKRYHKIPLGIRIFMSIAISQLIDTAAFTAWALGGWLNTFWDVFFWSYALKVLITIVLSASSWIGVMPGASLKRVTGYVQV